MKRLLTVLLILPPLALAGCGDVDPFATYSREVQCDVQVHGIELSPDGRRLAYCIETKHFREQLTGLLQAMSGGVPKVEKATYEVYTSDLATRRPPTLVGRWRRRETDRYTLWYFDGQHAALAVDDGKKRRFERIDVVTGGRKRVSERELPTELLDRGGSAWDERRRRHVEYASGEFLLWDPEKREYEFLFEMPRTIEGDSIPSYPGWIETREQRRRAHAIHRTWDCSARSESDSVHVTLQTYVPQPGGAERVYRLSYSLNVPAELPDPLYGHVSGHRDSELVVVTRTLGPRGQAVTQSFSTRELARIYAPQRRPSRESGVANTQIEVHFAPLPLAGDAGSPGTYGGDFAEAGVEFRFR